MDDTTKRLIEAAKDVLLEWDGGPMSEGGAYYRLEKAVAELQPEPDYLYEPIDSRAKAAMYLGCPCEAGNASREFWESRTLEGWSTTYQLPVCNEIDSVIHVFAARLRFRRLREGEVLDRHDVLPVGDGWSRPISMIGKPISGDDEYRRLVDHDGADFDWGSLK